MDSTFFQQKLNALRARVTGIREFQKQYEKELQLVTGSPAAQSKWKALIKGLKSQLEELSAEQELLVQQVANVQQDSSKSEAMESLSRLRHDIKILQSEQAILLGEPRAIAQNPPAPDPPFRESLKETDVQLKLDALRQRMQSSGTPSDGNSISMDSDRASSSAIAGPNPPIPPQEPTLAPAIQTTDHPDRLIEQVQQWTANQPVLTDRICQLILEHPAPIPPGQEAAFVKQIVEDQIISDWPNKAAAAHLELVQRSILDHAESPRLLSLYTEILRQGEVPASDNHPDQEALLDTGLVKAEQGKLKIANAIYQAVFNLDWAAQHALSPLTTRATEPPPRADDSGVARSTRLWSLGVLLLIPIAAIAYALLPKPTVAPPPAPMAKTPAADLNDSNLCASTLTDREGQLNKLGARKERDKESFPQACQSKLDELFYVTGMEKAKGDSSAGSDFNEGVRRLCKISGSSADHLIVARSQLNAWYGNEQNPAFKKFIINYLSVLQAEGQTCPAAKDISP